MLKTFGKGLTGLLSTKEEKQPAEKPAKNGTNAPKMNGTGHNSYHKSKSSQSYRSYQPPRDVDPSRKGHRDRRSDGGSRRRHQAPRDSGYYEQRSRYYAEQSYQGRRDYIDDRRQYSSSRYYDESQRPVEGTYGYDPSAPPKPPRGHQSQNKIYLPEETDDRMVTRNNHKNRHYEYSEQPSYPYDSQRPPQYPKSSAASSRSPQGYNILPDRMSLPQQRSSHRRHKSETAGNYRSFGSEPESEVRRSAVDENYNYSKRGEQDSYYPQTTASLDRRGFRNPPSTYNGYQSQGESNTGYQSDRAVDERGYNYNVPDWVPPPDTGPDGSSQVSPAYNLRPLSSNSTHRSDGELHKLEYRRRKSDPAVSTALQGNRGGWKDTDDYGRPYDLGGRDYSPGYNSLERASSRQDYVRYATDEEHFREPERDPPAIPPPISTSANYYSKPEHDDQSGFVQGQPYPQNGNRSYQTNQVPQYPQIDNKISAYRTSELQQYPQDVGQSRTYQTSQVPQYAQTDDQIRAYRTSEVQQYLRNGDQNGAYQTSLVPQNEDLIRAYQTNDLQQYPPSGDPSRVYQSDQPSYTSEVITSYYPTDLQSSSYQAPSLQSARPNLVRNVSVEEKNDPPPLRTPREIKAYDQLIRKGRRSSSESSLKRATVTASYQPVPTSPHSAAPSGFGQPVTTSHVKPNRTPARQRSRSQERPPPEQDLKRSQSPLSEPETSTGMRKDRSGRNSALFCITGQSSPVVSSDPGSDSEIPSRRIAPRDPPQREPPSKLSPDQQWQAHLDRRAKGQREYSRSSSQESSTGSVTSPKRPQQNGVFFRPVRSDTPTDLGDVVEEPVVLPSATRGDVYAIRDFTEKPSEPKPRNFYLEEIAHQKKWSKYANEPSKPVDVTEEPTILPSKKPTDVYAVREQPAEPKERNFHQEEVAHQKKWSNYANEPSSPPAVYEEPTILPSERPTDVYAVRDPPEKPAEPKKRNFYQEEIDHQKKWSKYLNEPSKPVVSEEPTILPSKRPGDVYAVNSKPAETAKPDGKPKTAETAKPDGKPKSFYEKELEAQAEQSRNVPNAADYPKVVEEALVLPSSTRGRDLFAVSNGPSETRPGRIKPANEAGTSAPRLKIPTKATVENEPPMKSQEAPKVESMPGTKGAFVDDPDSGGYQYKPYKKGSRSLDDRQSSKPVDSKNKSDDESPQKVEKPVKVLGRASRGLGNPKPPVDNDDDNFVKTEKSLSKGEQLFRLKKKEAEFDDLREKIVAHEKSRRLKILEAKAESEPENAVRRRNFFNSHPAMNTTPPSIELRMYSKKDNTFEYPSHKKVFQQNDKSPVGSPSKLDYPTKDRAGDPEPEPLVIEGVPEMLAQASSQEPLKSSQTEPVSGKDDTVLDTWQIAELKRAIKEYEDDVHSPRGRKKNRRERTKSELQNMLIAALVKLEQKDKEDGNTSNASSVAKPPSDEDRLIASRTQPLSNLYLMPRSNDNLGYSSDSSQDPQWTTRAERLTGIAGVQILARKEKDKAPTSAKTTVFPEEKHTAVAPAAEKRKEKPIEESSIQPKEEAPVRSAPLVTEETFPGEDIPMIDSSEPDSEQEQDSGTEEEMHVPKREKNVLAILKAGNRQSVDSVSSVDSALLSRPFEDIGSSEYEQMMIDHQEKKEMSNGRQSKNSSVDSLIEETAFDEGPGQTNSEYEATKRSRDQSNSSGCSRPPLRRDYRVAPQLEALPEEGSMTSRGSGYGVSKLRDRYAADRPSSLDSPSYSSSRTASSKSIGALQSRFSDKKEATPSGGKSTSTKVAKPKGVIEEKKKYGTPEKRLSSESGYGSLEREKGKDIQAQLMKTKNGKNGSIGKISENGSLPQKDPSYEMACNVAKTIAQQSGSELSDPESKKARMESYKEKRRRELAEKHGGGGEGLSRKPRRDPTGAPLSQPGVEGEVHHGKKNRRSMTEVVKPEETLKDRRERRVSNLSMETQQLVDTLESTRAARRERLRRSETEDLGNTYRILARHRERQSSISSTSSEVFPPKDANEPDPSEALIETEKTGKEESQPAAEKKRSVSLSSQTSQGTGDEESKDTGKTSAKAHSTKQSRDRRRRQNVAITAEDVKEARRIETEIEAKSSLEPSAEAKGRRSPFKWEAKVETPRRPSLENVSTDSEVSRSSPSPKRKIKASATQIETVTVQKTDKKSSSHLEDDKSKHLAKSSSFERRKLLRNQGSVSSTDEDSSSAYESLLKRQKPRSDSAPLLDVFQKRKERGSSQISTSDRTNVNKRSTDKPKEVLSQPKTTDKPIAKTKVDPKPKESKVQIPSKLETKEETKTKGSKGKVSSPPFQKQAVPQIKSETKPAEIVGAREQKWKVEEQADWVVIEEEVVSKKVVKGEQQSRAVSETAPTPEKKVEDSSVAAKKELKESQVKVSKKDRLSKRRSEDVEKLAKSDKAGVKAGDKMAADGKANEVVTKTDKKDEGKGKALDTPSGSDLLVKEQAQNLKSNDGSKEETKPAAVKESKELQNEGEKDQSEELEDSSKEKPIAGKKVDKKAESVIQRKSKPKTLQEKRLRSKTTEIPYGHRESPPSSPNTKKVRWRDRQGSFDTPLLPGEDVKRQALKTKDDDLFEVMRLRAQMIRDHEKEELAEKGHEVVESSSEESTSAAAPAPKEVIKVSVTDRMSAFRQGDSAPVPKGLVPKKILKKPTSIDVKPVAPAEESKEDTVSGGAEQTANQEGQNDDKSPDQLASLSLSEKMKLFASLSQQVKMESAPSPVARRRFPRKRYDDRSKTQPVTPEELHVIVKNAKERDDHETKPDEMEVEVISRTMEVVTEEPEVEAKEDELTKMSLSEKMKLFHEKAKSAPPPPKIQRPKKKRRSGSRYTTQPITLEEVKKASGPSPLVLSFGKGVDPEVAAGLSIGDQISLMYQAEDVETSKTTPVPSVQLPPKSPIKPSETKAAEGDLKKTGKLEGDRIKATQGRPKINLDTNGNERVPSTSIKEKPPSPSYPKSDGVDKSIKKARSLDQADMREIIQREKVQQTKSKMSTQKEIRAAAEKSRNEMLAEVSSSESEVDTKLISTMDQQPGLSNRHNIRKEAFGTKSSERYKTQPTIPTEDIPTPSPVRLRDKRLLHCLDPERRRSQPVTPEEMAEVRHIGSSSNKTKVSLADRLSALQQSGENDWRKRVETKDIPKSPKKSDSGSDSDKNSENTSISERLKLLQAKEESWKKRVEEKDVSQFTVEGKLKGAGKLDMSSSPAPANLPASPLRRVGSARKAPTKEYRVSLIEDSESEKSESTSNKVPAISLSDTTSVTTTTESEDSEPDFQVVRKSVAIPKADNETFSKFYQSSASVLTEGELSAITEIKHEASFELSVSDFDALTEGTAKSNRLTGLNRNDHRRSLRPQRRVRPSNNPLRALKTRSNILSEYTEEKMVLAEVEIKPQKKKKDFSNKSLAAMTQKVALSEEKAKLQGVKDFREMDGKLSKLLPYKDLMLIQIKGRRMVQVRLVEPKVSSLNSGDCFICVTPTNVFLWIGQYANVIEKSKASEVAQHIQSKKDLGCKASAVITVEEDKLKITGSTRNWKKMVEALGGKVDDVYQEVGANDEDQIHEIYVIDTNMVYRLQGSSLEPYGDYWATLLKYEMLKTDEILVFDFGSELYIWQGKKSSTKQRKKAIQLAYMLYERGYDYSTYDLNPLYPQETEGVKKADQRPEWVLFAKTSEHMETILFQSKFVDWPNESRLIKMKDSGQNQKETMPELVPFDAKLMIQPSKELSDVILEGTNVGRGTGVEVMPCNNNYNTEYFDKVERRGNKITTLSVMVWHVLEYTQSIIPKECFGQFHEGDTYVVRWQYRIEAAGARSLKGHASKWGGGGGRERCAYFFWQGRKSTINEKGASALMTVELDRERGPQRQVTEGKEPAVFLHLFQGRMMVHIGKREEEETNSQGSYRLYYIKGELETEASLVEVPCKMKMLRSRTSFVLLNLEDVDKHEASIHIWHGVKSSEVTRNIVRFAAERLKEFVPMEAGLQLECTATIEEMEEGSETEFFFKAVGNDRASYDSALGDELKYDHTIRLFHLTSSSGVFVANEIMNPSRMKEQTTPYPCLQSDMYSAEQPALFVLDNHFEVYLWQGWWPEEKQEVTGKMTGSAEMKWATERKCAMETVLSYCKEKNATKPPEAFLIHAGLEPQTFINLFPTWEMREDVAHINKKAGRRSDRAIRVRDVLKQLKRTRYSLAELCEKPEGVDPLKLETYLSDEEFKKVLGVTREQFEKLQSWKKTELKKSAGLF